ncbi:hypothetical protein [uncultured Gimesia sp.]|tara:strand:- start:7080 stop:7208 length:129 start_codon:yes stop_codon:yes gene_type:complete
MNVPGQIDKELIDYPCADVSSEQGFVCFLWKFKKAANEIEGM